MTFEPARPFSLIAATSGQATARTGVIRRVDYEVCTVEYVLSGAGFLEIDDRPAVRIDTDSVYFLPKHSSHCYYPDRDNPWHKLFFVIDGVLMEAIMQSYGLTEHSVLPDAASLKSYFQEFRQMFEHGGNFHNAAALLFHEFAVACQALQQSTACRLPEAEKLRQVLERDLGEKFVLNDYAEKVNLCSEHLIRLFYRSYGKTPLAYRMQYRLEEAKRLLSYSELSIKEIAALLGFSDRSSFSNRFKQCWRISPADYRRKKLF